MIPRIIISTTAPPTEEIYKFLISLPNLPPMYQLGLPQRLSRRAPQGDMSRDIPLRISISLPTHINLATPINLLLPKYTLLRRRRPLRKHHSLSTSQNRSQSKCLAGILKGIPYSLILGSSIVN